MGTTVFCGGALAPTFDVAIVPCTAGRRGTHPEAPVDDSTLAAGAAAAAAAAATGTVAMGSDAVVNVDRSRGGVCDC